MTPQGKSHRRLDPPGPAVWPRPIHAYRMACVHEWECQYRTSEEGLGWSETAVPATGGSGCYVANLRTNHGWAV